MTHYNLKGHNLCGQARARWDTSTADYTKVTCPACMEVLMTGICGDPPDSQVLPATLPWGNRGLPRKSADFPKSDGAC